MPKMQNKGGRLWESSLDVNFLMRGEHYQACKESGLNITVSKTRCSLLIFIISTHEFDTLLKTTKC